MMRMTMERMNHMKGLFMSKQAWVFVDILMVAGLVMAWVCSKMEEMSGNYWQSSHCITGMLWFLLIGIHVLQHWRIIRAFTKKKMIQKNKITAITILTFILMLISLIFLSGIFHVLLLKFHHIVGHFFMLIIVIHTINKYKRFASFFQTRKAVE